MSDAKDDLGKLREVAEAATILFEEDGTYGNATQWADEFDPPTVLRLLDRLEHHRETLRYIHADAMAEPGECPAACDVRATLRDREQWLFDEETA